MNKPYISPEEKKKWLTVVVLAFLILMVYLRFFLGPAVGKFNSLWSEIREIRRNLMTVQNAKEKLAQMEAETSELRKRTKKMEVRFPSRAELPELLEHLSDVAKKSEVDILEILPSGPIQTTASAANVQPIYEELPIAFMAKSGYHELGAFINHLESSERIFAVKNIEIKSDPSNPRKHGIRLVLGTFVRGHEEEK